MGNDIIDYSIIGFDAREMWLETEANWSADRKHKFLFRLDVSKPLSTDVMVWSSVFEFISCLRLPACLSHQDLWSDLDCLHETLNNTKITLPYWEIAITLSTIGRESQEFAEWVDFSFETSPHKQDSQWTFLGYDVSDKWLLSGLSNCGFLSGENDIQQLRDCWGKHLNEFHLFDDIKRATEFREFSNERVKEHAPFFVFGLWLIEQVNAP